MTVPPENDGPLFVFDLDATLTKCELLPLIAQSIGLDREMARLTEDAMQGKYPFERNFCNRVAMLKEVPVSQASAIAARMPVHEKIVGFVRQNPKRCLIITGNLDVWIASVIEKMGMNGRCLCSKALVCEDRVIGIEAVLNKTRACDKLPRPYVAIGDGSNDIGMLKNADIGIAFGGVHKPPAELIAVADMIVWDETELVEILEKQL